MNGWIDGRRWNEKRREGVAIMIMAAVVLRIDIVYIIPMVSFQRQPS